MLHSLHDMVGYRMMAKDGEIGNVEEFYFDDQSWNIRYLILKTGHWLNGRRLLISPISILNKSFQKSPFQVDLSKKQVRISPDIDTDKPVSRQQEMELYGHYAWQGYWESCFYEGGLEEAADTAGGIGKKIANEESLHKKVHVNIHLRSSFLATGYPLFAADGEIGQINDFVMDDASWQLSYLTVCREALYGGGTIRIPISQIKQMQWNESEFYIKGNVDSIKNIETLNDPARI